MNERRIDPERDPVYAAAAEWLSRLRQPRLTLEETLAWQQWMSQAPHNRRAFLELEELWDKFDSLATPQLVAPEALGGDNYDGSIPVSDWATHSHSVRPPDTWRWLHAAILLIALTCLAVGPLFAPTIIANLSGGKSFETAIGENASLRLADGSRVRLGGHTRLEVLLGPRLRRIDLLSGEAYFEVAKDRARPFLVRAGTATVTAVGTEFNVRRSDDRVVVSVLEGRVLVQPLTPVAPLSWLPTSKALGSPAPVSAGERTTINRGGVESTQVVGDAAGAVAWQDGRLAFEAEPLRYVLQDVNRYTTKPIVMADSRIGDLRVTGTITETNIVGWVNSLQAAFGVHADIQTDRIVLRWN